MVHAVIAVALLLLQLALSSPSTVLGRKAGIVNEAPPENAPLTTAGRYAVIFDAGSTQPSSRLQVRQEVEPPRDRRRWHRSIRQGEARAERICWTSRGGCKFHTASS
ncbi:unnamed protein product [Urochloa humidicola]